MSCTPTTCPFTIDTTSLPAATRGQLYSATVIASGGTPTLPLKWKKVGKLPKGLKLSKTGVISGTPKKLAGTFTFGVTVRDSAKAKQRVTATRTFSIVVG